MLGKIRQKLESNLKPNWIFSQFYLLICVCVFFSIFEELTACILAHTLLDFRVCLVEMMEKWEDEK